MTYRSVNPFDNKLFKSFEELTDSQLEQKVAAATACFASWKHTSYAHRAKIIARAGVLLHEQADQFAKIMTLEMGKRLTEARGEVEFSAKILGYYAETQNAFLRRLSSTRPRGRLTWKVARSALYSGLSRGTFPTTSLPGSPGPI